MDAYNYIYMYFCFRYNNDNGVLLTKSAKGDSEFANKFEATTLQPKQINGKIKSVMPEKAGKTISTGSTKEQGISKSVGLQTEKIMFKNAHSQTRQVKFKNTASQTEEDRTTKGVER